MENKRGMWYVKHKSTTPVYFDIKEIMLRCVENELELSRRAAREGGELKIEIGFVTDFPRSNK